MKALFGVYLLSLCIVCAFGQRVNNATTDVTTNATTVDDKAPTVHWGRCPQLEPKEGEKRAKQAVLDACLQKNPIPANLTQSTIESHQKSIAECALRAEKWISKAGNYRYSKAEAEIKAKKMAPDVERALLSHHKNCQSEAKREFARKSETVDQIQLYQACMDYHITSACAIRIQ